MHRSLECNPPRSFTCTRLPKVLVARLTARLPLPNLTSPGKLLRILLMSVLIVSNHSGFDPEPLAEQLSRSTPVPIPYKAPFDWARWGTSLAFLLFFALTARFVYPFFANRWVWAVGTILTTLTMTSGFMFTRIRGTPYSGSDGGWIAPGYQNQYGQETQVVAVMCE
jgi:hypothetical protein